MFKNNKISIEQILNIYAHQDKFISSDLREAWKAYRKIKDVINITNDLGSSSDETKIKKLLEIYKNEDEIIKAQANLKTYRKILDEEDLVSPANQICYKFFHQSPQLKDIEQAIKISKTVNQQQIQILEKAKNKIKDDIAKDSYPSHAPVSFTRNMR